MPDLLIGQDLVHLFKRRFKPTLPNGYYIVRTFLGPTIGGARRNVTQLPKATTSSRPSAAHSAAQDSAATEQSSRRSRSSPPSRPDRIFSRLHLRPPELVAYCPANNAGGIADSSREQPVRPPDHNTGEAAVSVTNECLESSTTTDFSSGPLSKPVRVPGVSPRSAQQHPSTKPLDTQPLLVPTFSTTCVNVEEVSAANNAAELLRLQVKEVRAANNAAGFPRPIQDTLSFTEAELNRSSLPPPAQGNLVHALLSDVGPPIERKTRKTQIPSA